MSRRRPKTPEQIAAARLAKRVTAFEAVGLQREAAVLSTSDDVEITRAGEARGSQRVQIDLARRLDAFEALRKRMPPGAYDAARRLERDITIRRGEHDKGRGMERLDNAAGKDRTDRMIAAGRRVDAVLERLPERDAWLLTELIRTTLPVRTWREVVAHITGEMNDHAQAAAVRAACVNLRDAYERRLRKTA